METLTLLLNGFAAAVSPTNLLFAFIGCLLGNPDRRIAGVGVSRRHRDFNSAHLQAGPDRRHHHAVLDLLWRDVRRHHHHRASQCAGRGVLGRYRHRRLSDGETRESRAGTWHLRHRFVYRRHCCDNRAGRRCHAAVSLRSQLRAAGILCADAVRPMSGHRRRRRIAGGRHSHDASWAASRLGRHRPGPRLAAIHLRNSRPL